MKKCLIIISLISFIIACSDQEEAISIPETIRIQETVLVEVTKVVEKEKIIYLDPTFNPDPTWTPTSTPVVLPSWTPTALPISKPTWTPTPTPKPAETWTPTPTPSSTPTPTSTPLNWEYYVDGILVTPTPRPAATWTATPTPKPAATWTPTPTPTPLPPDDLGFELTSFSFTVNHTDFGQIFTVGITEDKSPIVDHNQNNDLTDEITLNDPTNYNILSVSHKKNSVSEITFIGLTPTGTTNINMTFYTTRK